MVQNSFKYLSSYLHVIKEPFATLAHNIFRVEVEISTNRSDFLYRIVRDCAKTNVLAIALLEIPYPV